MVGMRDFCQKCKKACYWPQTFKRYCIYRHNIDPQSQSHWKNVLNIDANCHSSYFQKYAQHFVYAKVTWLIPPQIQEKHFHTHQTNLSLLQKLSELYNSILNKNKWNTAFICKYLAPSISLEYHFNPNMAYIRVHTKNQPHDFHGILPQMDPEKVKRYLLHLRCFLQCLPCCLCSIHIYMYMSYSLWSLR